MARRAARAIVGLTILSFGFDREEDEVDDESVNDRILCREVMCDEDMHNDVVAGCNPVLVGTYHTASIAGTSTRQGVES